MTVASQAHVVRPGEGRRINGLGIQYKVMSADLEGRLFAFEGRLEPGHVIPSHTHSREDEVTVVLRGELEVELGGVVSRVPAGSVVVKPRGVAHSLRNPSDLETTVLELHTPGGLEPYYEALGNLFASPGDPEWQARIEKLQAEYGITHGPAPVEAR